MTFSLAKSSRSSLAIFLSLLAVHGYAERAFVGMMEIDSVQGVNRSAVAFSHITDLALVQEQVSAWLADNLFLPTEMGISASEPLRIVHSIDPAAPPSHDNPANVMLVSLTDNGAVVRKAFAAAYATQKTLDSFTIFESPSDAKHPPRMAVAFAGRKMFASTSLPALTWAWTKRDKLIAPPSVDLPGTFRVLVNPQRFADLLGSRSEPAASAFGMDKLLREFESLSFSFTLDGTTVALSLRGTPKQGTDLDKLAASWRPVSPPVWHVIPDNTFFTFIGTFDKPNLWPALPTNALSPLLRPIAGHVPQTAFPGEHLSYIAPSHNGKGLCLVQFEPLKDPAPVQQAIPNLQTSGDTNSVATLTHSGQREVSGTTIETYAISLPPPAGADAGIGTIAYTTLSLLLKSAILETAVTNGCLITVIGPPGAIDAHLPPAAFRAKLLTLNRKISGQDPALNESLTLGGTLRPTDLLRHAVSIMPEITPEQIKMLPKGGNGATFGICQNGRTLTASLRLHTTEIAALQRINRDGRTVLQDVFFQIITKQLMENQPK